MTALYILGGIALFILLVLLLPLRVHLEYNADGFFLKLRLLFVTLVAVPGAEKGEKKLRAEKKKEKEPKEKQGGLVKTLFAMWPDILRAAGKLLRGLRIPRLKVWYLAASEDAAAAALQFGRMNAAMGAVTALLENVFRIGKTDYRLDISFEKSQAEVYIEGWISIQIWRLVGIAFGLLFAMVRHSPAPVKKEVSEKKSAEPEK